MALGQRGEAGSGTVHEAVEQRGPLVAAPGGVAAQVPGDDAGSLLR